MKKTQSISRITTFWAATESGLGGILHGLQSPFTGLIVGGLSVLFICLIAHAAGSHTDGFWRQRTNIVRAIVQSTIIVLAVKSAVTPHSPLGAYFAVSLQAVLGIVFFTMVPWYKLSALLFCVLATVASAVQKLLILTIIYGMAFWEALDAFILQASQNMAFLHFSEEASASVFLVSLFIGVYLLGGLFIGWYAARLPNKLYRDRSDFNHIIEDFGNRVELSEKLKKKRNRWAFPLILVSITVGIFALEFFFISAHTAVSQLLRTVSILLAWVLLLRPILNWVFKRLLKQHSNAFEAELFNALDLIPKLASFTKFIWRRSRMAPKKINRKQLLLLFLYFGLHES